MEECGFLKGNNQKFQNKLNQDVIAKFARLFEADDDDDEFDNQLMQTKQPIINQVPGPDSMLQPSFITPSDSKLFTEQDLGNSFRHDSSSINDIFERIEKSYQKQETKISSSFTSKNERLPVGKGMFLLSKKVIPQEVLVPAIQPMVTLQTFPLYERNSLLLLKLRKLDRWLIGQHMDILRRQALKESSILTIDQVGLTSLRDYKSTCPTPPMKLIKSYFKANYPRQLKDNKEQFKEWLEPQIICLLPKLIAYRSCPSRGLNEYNLVRELEYRFYIQWILQQRTIIQRIRTNDSPLRQYLVLLVEQIIFCLPQNRYFLRLSDGWYPIYLVVDYREGQQTGDRFLSDLLKEGRIKQGDKVSFVSIDQLHIMNLQRYPIQIDVSKVITDSNPLLCCVPANSVKRAPMRAKLGQQEWPYFLRSVASLKQFGGTVPALDLFVLHISYLIEGFGVTRKAVDVTPQDSQSPASAPLTHKWCVLKCIDALHYFDQTQPNRIVYLTIRYVPLHAYEQIQQGDRIRVVNCEVTSVLEGSTSLDVKCTPSSGVLSSDLKQYPAYGKQQIKDLVRVLDLSTKKQQRCDLVMRVTEFTRENEITGLIGPNFMVKLVLHLPRFFGRYTSPSRIVNEIVIVTDIMARSILLNFPPFMGYCTTTDSSRFIVCRDHWVPRYESAINELKLLGY